MANSSKRKLRTPRNQVRRALNYQRSLSTWDFYEEREFLENILSQRINFVIAAFALIIGAAATVAKETKPLMIILGIGFCLQIFLLITTYRVYTKLDTVIQMLYDAEPREVFPMIKQEFKLQNKWWNLRPMLLWIYVGLPAFCTLTMLTGLICVYCGVLKF